MVVGGQLHAPTALPPGKGPGTHCIGGWVGTRACLDGCEKSRHHRDFCFNCIYSFYRLNTLVLYILLTFIFFCFSTFIAGIHL
jgi:hypothetical protein